jgi:hydroxyacylglutathione hydrolase
VVEIVPLVDEGLGNSSYLVGLDDGRTVVVDPSRDPGAYLAEAEQRGWRIGFVAETHLHADFVSGSQELARATGAVVLAAAGARMRAPHRELDDGEEVDLGGLTLRAIATPGHTPEHLTYLLLDGPAPVALFSGGTLIVGGAARPDLLGPEHTEPLARAAYRSIHQRLLTLPDDLPVYPTHGAGSFCSAGTGGDRSTTIGRERATNSLLAARDEDAFVALLLGGLGSYPPYFLQLRPINQAGPPLHGPATGKELVLLTPSRLRLAVEGGAALVDARSVQAYAAAHVPGSLSIPLRPQFAPWLGWLVDLRQPLAFVLDETTDRAELVRQCRKIGFERFVGELAGGLDAWRNTGLPLTSIPLVEPGHLDGAERLLDVRQHSEWAAGHIEGAAHVELGALAHTASEQVPGAPLVVHCGHGERAMTAASLLERDGRSDVCVLLGGPSDYAAATGRRVQIDA